MKKNKKMKQIIVLFFFLAIAGLESANAQINLNFSAGINNSNCKIENLGSTSSAIISAEGRLGYFAAVAPSYQINDKLNLLVDFQYSLKGCNMIVENTDEEIKTRLTYVDIIPEIEFKIIDYLLLGVGFNSGFNVKEAQRLENGGWVNLKESGFVDLFDFGLTGKVKAVYNNFFGFVRYNYGLTNISSIIFTDLTGQTVIQSSQYNRNLQIGVGYSLGL